MGLQKACIIFIAGIFFISLIKKKRNLKMIKDVPVLGTFYGDTIIAYIEKYNMHGLLIMITALVFIL